MAVSRPTGYRPTGHMPTGYRRTGYRPTGHRPTGYMPTGYRPTGYRPTGYMPNGFRPTGYRPTGYRPTGYRPTGHRPTGHRPTGYMPTGYRPTGSRPTGYRPTGYMPTGYRPTGHRPTGYRPTGYMPTGIGLLGICLLDIGLLGIGLLGIGLLDIGLLGIGILGIGLLGIGIVGIGLQGIGLLGIGLQGSRNVYKATLNMVEDFFGRSIHSLSKIGEELYIEPLEHGLALRTVNTSRSAYACFLFSPSFFQNYDDGSGQIVSDDSEEDSLRCKIAMKSCLTVFKSLSNIEKTVDRCKLTLDLKESRLVFQLYCKHGIVKTHNLAFIECETLQAVFSKNLCPNVLTAPSKLFCDAVVNFQTSQEEITLSVCPEKVSIKNYVEDEPDPNKVMLTELTLLPEEFDSYQIGVDAEVTFCLKELRAILAFADITNLPLSLNFETSGKPIVFSIDSDSSFEANFVLATLADASTQNSASQQRSQAKARRSNKSQAMSKNSKKDAGPVKKSKSDRPSFPYENSNGVSEGIRVSVTNGDRMAAACKEFMNDDDDMDMTLNQVAEQEEALSQRLQKIQPPQTSREQKGLPREQNGSSNDSQRWQSMERPRSPQPSTSREQQGSPVIPLQTNTIKDRINPHDISLPDISVMENITMTEFEEEDDDIVPGTPPSKKFKSLFFGLSQSSSVVSQQARSPIPVLAEDTDDEDD